MKFTVEIDVDLPRERMIELFDDPRNLVKWQRGLVRFEALDGVPGQPGARSKLVYRMGKRTFEMIETIAVRNLPDEFSGTYDAPGMHTFIRNVFVAVGPNRTRWVSENEFELRGVMKLIGFFMKGTFPKQSLKFMQDFKAFAETGTCVTEPPAT